MKKTFCLLSLFIITLIFQYPALGCSHGLWEGLYTDFSFDPELGSSKTFSDYILKSYSQDFQDPRVSYYYSNYGPQSSPSAAEDFIKAVESDSRLDPSEKKRLIAKRKQYELPFADLKDKLSWNVSDVAVSSFEEGDFSKTLAEIDRAINECSKIIEDIEREMSKCLKSTSACMNDIDCDEEKKKDLIELKEKIARYAQVVEFAKGEPKSKTYGYDEYLHVVKAFKYHNYSEALEHVRVAKELSVPKWTDKLKFWDHSADWLYQTACYMEARLLFILAQEDSSAYSYTPIDHEVLAEAKDLFDDYLKKFPRGFYAESAHNIHRFMYRIDGDDDSFHQALVDDLKTVTEALRSDPTNVEKRFKYGSMLREVERFIDEIDDYDSVYPIKLANSILSGDPVELEEIESQKEEFKLYPGLYDLVWTWRAYQNQEYQRIADRKFEKDTPTQLVTQFIQIRALRMLKRYDDALNRLRESLKGEKKDYLESEVLCIYSEMGKGYAQFFLEPLSDEIIADALMYAVEEEVIEDWVYNQKNKYPEHVLSLMAGELMMRYLAQGKIQEAMKLFNAVSQKLLSQYDDIRPTIEALAKDPNDMTATLQIGRYLHNSRIGLADHYDYGEQNRGPFMCERCGFCKDCIDSPEDNCKQFQDKRNNSQAKSPYYYYLKVVEHFEKTKEKSDLEAEALSKLSKCGHGIAPSLKCVWGKEGEFWEKVDVKKMFQILHKKYKGSTWAEETPVFYYY